MFNYYRVVPVLEESGLNHWQSFTKDFASSLYILHVSKVHQNALIENSNPVVFLNRL